MRGDKVADGFRPTVQCPTDGRAVNVDPFTVPSLQPIVLRAPIDEPVRTVVGTVGGLGLLEVDSNDNPSREGLAEPFPPLLPNGCYDLGEAPGLGVEPEPTCLASYGSGL